MQARRKPVIYQQAQRSRTIAVAMLYDLERMKDISNSTVELISSLDNELLDN